MKLTYTEAVEAIMNNYPPEQYSILRQALNMAIDLMTEKAREEANFKVSNEEAERLRKELKL